MSRFLFIATLLYISTFVFVFADYAPQQINLAFTVQTQTSTGMAVSWATNNQTQTSIVKYGTTSGVYPFTAQGTSSSYYEIWNNNVILSDLQFSTKYYYVCGDNVGGWSEEYSFVTNPPDGTVTYPFKIGVFGDMGVKNGNDTRDSLIKYTSDVVFYSHVGDIGYSDDNPTSEFEKIWNTFQNDVQPLSAYKPYMTCPGNHEATCHSFGDFFCPKHFQNFTAYRYRYRMPSEESGSTAGNMWYSYTVGRTHFISISTETDIPQAPEGPDSMWRSGPFGDQLTWLENDLIEANNLRTTQPLWIIVFGHRPLYTTMSRDFPLDAHKIIRNAFENLFNQYKVDMYICGHVHAYERIYPIYDNKLIQTNYTQPPVPVYIVIGNAGNIEGHTTHWIKDTPDWLAFRNDQDYGYAVMTFDNDTTLNWQMFRATDGSLADEFTLIKEPKTQEVSFTKQQ